MLEVSEMFLDTACERLFQYDFIMLTALGAELNNFSSLMHNILWSNESLEW